MAEIEAIQKLKMPTTVTVIRQVIGWYGEYREFVERFSDFARPIIRLTRKNVLFEWTDKCQTAFQKLKKESW